jgi:purine-binding chemotaxis protein CheW
MRTVAESVQNEQMLLLRAGRQNCALPLRHVLETMRPLTIKPVSGVPAFIRGLSIIRGEPVPVVDLGLILGLAEADSPRRFVLLEAGGRKLALAVESVLGVWPIEASVVRSLPPLLQNADPELISGISVRDQNLLLVLQAGRIVPAGVWSALDGEPRS